MLAFGSAAAGVLEIKVRRKIEMHDRKLSSVDEYLDRGNPSKTLRASLNPADVNSSAPAQAPNATERWPFDMTGWRLFQAHLTRQSTIRILHTIARWLTIAFITWFMSMALLIAAYGFVNPPGSALMLIRSLSGTTVKQRWKDIEDISPNLVRAVIVSEDSRFCRHWGIDIREIEAAIRRSRNGIPRGASTLTMQVAKNLFLWPSKSYFRKALEVPLTMLIELFWSKRRIMEVYLNIVEWGPGVFGAEQAARHHFKTSASRLGPAAASLLAVSLPNPIRRKAGRPGRLTSKLSRVIRARARANRSAASCVIGAK